MEAELSNIATAERSQVEANPEMSDFGESENARRALLDALAEAFAKPVEVARLGKLCLS